MSQARDHSGGTAVAEAPSPNSSGPKAAVRRPSFSAARRPHVAVPAARDRHNEPATDGEIDPITLACDLVQQVPSVQVFRAIDDSMADAGVLKGDSVLIQACTHVNDGELALVKHNRTLAPQLRRVYEEGGRYRLVPEDRSSKPVGLPMHAVQIQGRVVAIVRQRLAA